MDTANWSKVSVPLAAGMLAAAVLAGWLGLTARRPDPSARLPGGDDAPAAAATATASRGVEWRPPEPLSANALGVELTTGPGRPSDLPGAWPQFRGPGRDGFILPAEPLARDWPEGGPAVLWGLDVGEGYAAPAVVNGRVYLLDYDRPGQRDVLRCLSLADGAEIWACSYPVEVKRNHGMSRTVPAVTDGFVVSLGPKCQVLCLDANTGRFRWSLDLAAQYGTTVPAWYAGQCPRIDDGVAILAPGGPRALMVAIDCNSGRTVWTTPNPMGWQMTHVSILRARLAGRDTYVYSGSGGVAGVDANSGELLWQTGDWKINIAAVATPVAVGGDRVFLSGGYNAGAMMLHLRDDAGRIVPEVLFRLPADVFGAAQQTPIFRDGAIYGVRPNGELTCLDLDGKVLWTSGEARRYGLGPYLLAGDLMYVMDDHGLVTLAEVNSQSFTPLAEAKLLSGIDSWGPMALAGRRLLLRDLTRLICVDVGAR